MSSLNRHAARELNKDGNSAGGIALIDGQMQEAKSEVATFMWQAGMVRFLLELGAAELALAHLESMEAKVLEYSLERWDPDRAIEVAWLALQVDKSINAKMSCKSRSLELKEIGKARICRLIPADAMKKFGSRTGA